MNRNDKTGKTHTLKKRTKSQRGGVSPAITRAATAEEIREGDRIVVTVKRIGINGEGVGYYKRKAVFIPGALPDEVVKAQVVRTEPSYMLARLTEIEKRSPIRTKPECPVYEACGGCQLQHMTYEGQLRAKEELVREAFRRYVGMETIPLRPMMGMDRPWGYRNKAQLQAGIDQGKLVAGLYSAGSHRIVDISGCPIQQPVINDTVNKVKQVLGQLDIPIYNEKTGEGLVRTIVARLARQSGEVQLTLVTAGDEIPRQKELVSRIRDTLPYVVTIAQNINSGKTPLIFGERTKILWGREYIRETLGNLTFDLSPRAFFQLNPEQTVKLYRSVAEAADLQGGELVIDAYCGTGTIALWLAPRAGEVRGIESVPEAVEDARRNAETKRACQRPFLSRPRGATVPAVGGARIAPGRRYRRSAPYGRLRNGSVACSHPRQTRAAGLRLLQSGHFGQRL